MLDESGKVTFSPEEQAEVDRIIGERLARVKSEKPEDYDDLKELANELDHFGYQGTAAEKKAAMRALREEQAKQTELQELQEQAAQTGTSPELLAEIKALKSELSELKQDREKRTEEETKKIKEAEEKAKQAENFNKQIEELQKDHEGIDIDALAKDEDFLDFVSNSNPSLTLSQMYTRYLKYTNNAESKAISKIQKNIDRSTSSGKGKGTVGETHGLTPRQQALAEENGLSYKEYAQALSLIKRG